MKLIKNLFYRIFNIKSLCWKYYKSAKESDGIIPNKKNFEFLWKNNNGKFNY